MNQILKAVPPALVITFALPTKAGVKKRNHISIDIELPPVLKLLINVF